MKYMGIDYGLKRVGVAVSDESGKIAFPKAVYQNEPGLAARIGDLAANEKIAAIVLGESKDYSGNDNPVMADITAFKAELEASGMTVVFEPEFMTSAHAARSTGTDMLDASAAALILQSYLDRENKN